MSRGSKRELSARRAFPVLGWVVAAWLAHASCDAQQPVGAEVATPAARLPASRRSGVTPEQEAAVRSLVEQHHPDLMLLLDQLRQSRPSQYVQAVRELFRISVRLASIQERDMERYDLELKKWKLESQTQLLALKVASMQAEADDDSADALLADLRGMAHQLLRTRTALLELERDRQRQRLAKLDEQLEELTAAGEQQVASDVESMLRSARVLMKGQPAKSPAPVSKAPVGKTPVSKTPVSKAPVSKAPVSKAPVSKAPVSKAPDAT